MIKFSIIIPHYNIPLLLKQLLDSIPDTDDIEIIVVDDNSNENIEEYQELVVRSCGRNIVFLRNDSGEKGAGACKNIGLENATGKWILFADADDYFTERFHSLIRENVDREEDVIFFYPTSRICGTDELSDRHLESCKMLKKYLDDPSLKHELQLRFIVVSPWSKMIRREMLSEYGIRFETTRVANDVFFCRQLGVYSRKIAVVGDTIYVVTKRTGSLTTHLDMESFDIRRDVYIRSCKYVRERIAPNLYRKIHYTGGMFMHNCRISRFGLKKLIETVFVFARNGIFPIG